MKVLVPTPANGIWYSEIEVFPMEPTRIYTAEPFFEFEFFAFIALQGDASGAHVSAYLRCS